MLVITAGTMTIASARDGCIVTASNPIETVGRPSPSTPLTKPASRNTAAIRIMKGSNMAETLTDRRDRHNLEVTEIAFGNNEGREASHALRPGRPSAVRRGRRCAQHHGRRGAR